MSGIGDAPAAPEVGVDYDADDSAEGPIELPPGASCAGCHYSALVRPGQQIQQVRICRRFPPGSIVIPGPQGPAISSQPPMVSDDYVCFEFDARVAPAIIPTALG